MKRWTVPVVLAVTALSLVGPAAPGTVPHWNAWLCFPGSPTDWCDVVLKTTTVTATGSRTVTVPAATNPPIDCFYLYPTVSEQRRGNSTLTVDPEEKSVAVVQAAEFSRVCRVFAPMYQQVTVDGYGNPFHGSFALEYKDVLAAWRDYIAHYNDGRGVVLIGHSEGAGLFKELIQKQIERTFEQKLLVSAILLGGDIVVEDGSTEGGDFTSVPACTSMTETGCVVAYSSWNRTPPPGDDLVGGASRPASEHVLCVNPAAPGSTKAAAITPIFEGQVPEGIVPLRSAYDKDTFVAFPDLYTARCVQQGSRAWLLIKRIHTPGDKRPTVQPILGAGSGLHAADVSIALENLVALVASERTAWLAHR